MNISESMFQIICVINNFACHAMYHAATVGSLNGTSVYCITELKRSKTIYRIADRNKFERVALVGPLTNLVMGFSFLISTYIYPYHSYLYAGGII